MRLSATLIAALALGATTGAMAQDRYGPTRIASQTAASYDAPGTTLAWSGKTYGQQTEAPALRSGQPQPLLNGALRNTSVSPYARLQIAPSVQTAQPSPAQRASAQPAPQAAPQASAMQTASAQPAPTRAASPVPALRPAQPTATTVANAPINHVPAEAAQPAPARAAAQTQQTVVLAGGPPASQQVAPQQAAPMTAPLSGAVFDGVAAPEEVTTSSSAAVRARMAANAANSGGTVSPRYYSVHSAYGMAADPIPLAQTGVGQ